MKKIGKEYDCQFLRLSFSKEMDVHYFVDEKLIPNDGSKELIEQFAANGKQKDSMYIYPDVHYKKGACGVNGTLIKSERNIYPSYLGVENCGFTVGEICQDISEKEILNSIEKYVCALQQGNKKRYTNKETWDMFEEYLKEEYIKNQDFYAALGIGDVDELKKKAERLLKGNLLRCASESLGYMGGGNHFFEIHELLQDNSENATAKYIIILHSDSVSVGNRINLLFSNLNELNYESGLKKVISKGEARIRQALFYIKRGIWYKAPGDVIKLIFSKDIFRTIDSNSALGKEILFVHNIAAIFGDMNRSSIIGEWSFISGISCKQLFSHSHDSVKLEYFDGNFYVIQRSGVQFLGDDSYFALPGAMGNGVFIMENSKNKKAFFSANHGTGRVQDKHIARQFYRVEDTMADLSEHKIKLFQIGKGEISEQDRRAFKNMESVAKAMEEYKLGRVVARTRPIAIIKG